MHGKSNMTRRVTPAQLERNRRTPSITTIPPPTPQVDVGDWAIAQDEDGSLILHNVMTGNRIVIARP